jgi:hypothetical protein
MQFSFLSKKNYAIFLFYPRENYAIFLFYPRGFSDSFFFFGNPEIHYSSDTVESLVIKSSTN